MPHTPIPLGNLAIGCYGAGAFARLHRRQPLDDIAATIAGDALARPTAAYRKLAGTDPAAAKRQKARAFPSVTFSGVIVDGYESGGKGKPDIWRPGAGYRKGGKPVNHAGLYQVDLDGIGDRERAAALRDAAGQLDWVALAFVSPSYGVKIIARGNPAPDAEAHLREWTHANQLTANALGLDFDAGAVDPAVKAINGLCFLCHDAGAWYNPNAAPLDPAPPPTRAERRRNPDRPTTPLPPGLYGDAAAAAAFLQTAIPPPGAGTYTDWLATAKSVGGLFGDDALARWIAGSNRPDDRVNGLAGMLAGESDSDWLATIIGIARRRGWTPVGTESLPLPPAVTRALAAAAPQPEHPPSPRRPDWLPCANAGWLCIIARDCDGQPGRRLIECHRCPACREWRRMTISARFELGRADRNTGAVALITELESPAAAAAIRKAENRYGGARWTAIGFEDGAGYTLRIAYLDALDAGAAAAFANRMTARAVTFELHPELPFTGDDIEGWTPDARRWYPTDDGWTDAIPPDWKHRPAGVKSVTAAGFSRNWPAGGFRLPPSDYAYGDAHIERDQPPTELVGEELARRRMLMAPEPLAAFHAWKHAYTRPAPAPELVTALETAQRAGDRLAARLAAGAIQTATGFQGSKGLLRHSVDGSRAAHLLIREWLAGQLADDAPVAIVQDDAPAPDDRPPPPWNPCAICGRRAAVPGRAFCLACDPSPLDDRLIEDDAYAHRQLLRQR